MAVSNDSSVLGQVQAHPAGHGCLALLSGMDTTVLTGGCDGELALYEWQSEGRRFTLKTHRRVHRGAVLAVAVQGSTKFYSVGEDGSLYLVERSESDDGGSALSSRLVYRSTLPLRQVACTLGTEHERIACAGDEMKIAVVQPDATIVWTSDTLKSFPVALTWSEEKKLLIYVEEKGRIVMLDQDFSQLRTCNLSTTLSKTCTLTLQGRRLFLCCRDGGLFVLEADTLALIDHIRPPSATAFTACYLADSKQWLLFHSRGLAFLDPTDLDLSDDLSCPAKDVVCISGSQPSAIFAMTADGTLSCIGSSSVLGPAASAQRLQSKTHVESDSDGEMDEEEASEDDDGEEEGEEEAEEERDSNFKSKGKKTSKRGDKKRPPLDNDSDTFGEFEDYDVNEEESPMEVDKTGAASGNRAESPFAMTAAPRCIHEAFQPASTPFIHGYAILCWNTTGIISSRQDSGYCSVEVEFNDKNYHRPIRFIDEEGYTMGSVGRAGAIFASPADPARGKGSKIYMAPVDLQDRSIPWMLDLPESEQALGVAIGGAKYCVVATSAGRLRSFTPNGLQGLIINYPGRYVSMAASGDQLVLLHADEFSSELGFILYDLNTLRVRKSGPVGGGLRKTRLTWLGIEVAEDSSNSIMALFDERATLHLYLEEMGAWQPWLDCTRLDAGSEEEGEGQGVRIWPISANTLELQCLRLTGPERHPEIIPRPLPTVLSLQIPLIGVHTDPSIKSYEHVLRHHTILSPSPSASSSPRPPLLSLGGTSEKELKRLKLTSDKHVLELIQLSLKADRPGRVLELCPLFMMEKSWEMVIQLVKHHRMMHLVDRIEALHERCCSKVSELGGVPTPRDIGTFHAPKPPLPERVAIESPSTTLANLTPLVLRRDAAPPATQSPAPSKRPLPSSPTERGDQAVAGEGGEETIARLANPLSRLSFERPSGGSSDHQDLTTIGGEENANGNIVPPSSSFLDALKNVQAATISGTGPKRGKTLFSGTTDDSAAAKTALPMGLRKAPPPS